MDRSPFQRLAPEIRNRIYEFALQSERPFEIVITAAPARPKQRSCEIQHHVLALARTCNVVNKECSQLFYAVNTFNLTGSSSTYLLRKLNIFTKAIGPVNSRALGSVIMDLGTTRYLRSSKWAGVSQLQDLLRGTAKAVRSGDLFCRCIVKAVVPYPASYKLATLPFGVDFGNPEKTWDESLELIRQRMEAAEVSTLDRKYMQLMLEVLDTCRQEARAR